MSEAESTPTGPLRREESYSFSNPVIDPMAHLNMNITRRFFYRTFGKVSKWVSLHNDFLLGGVFLCGSGVS